MGVIQYAGSQIVYAAIAQLGERQTEDLKIAGSNPAVVIGTAFRSDK